MTLYDHPAATLYDLRESVEILESVANSWKRIFGPAHPETPKAQDALKYAREALAARLAEAPRAASGEVTLEQIHSNYAVVGDELARRGLAVDALLADLHLTELNLRFSKLDSAGAEDIAECLGMATKLTKLDVSANGLSPAARRALASSSAYARTPWDLLPPSFASGGADEAAALIHAGAGQYEQPAQHCGVARHRGLAEGAVQQSQREAETRASGPPRSRRTGRCRP